jgi:hypothetical protein
MSALLFFAEWPKNDGPGQPLTVEIGFLSARRQFPTVISKYEFEQCEFRNLDTGL